MPLDLDKLRDKKARRTSTGWTPKEGDNLIRVLPFTSRYFTEDLGDIALEFRSHFLKAEGADTQVVRCLRDKKEPCAFCTAANKNRESTNPVLKKAAEQIRPSERHLMNIVNLNDIPAGLQVYETGPKVYDGILEFASNPAWGDIVNPTSGKNITLKQIPGNKSRSGYNEYAVVPHPTSTDITPHLPADWKERLDGLEASMPSYPAAEDVNRWLKILGMDEGVVVAASVAPPPVTVTPPTPTTVTAPVAVAPVTVTPVTAPASQAPSGTDAASVFAGAHGLGVKVADGKPVPVCFSEGPENKDIGFNPAKYPCERGCPSRAECQLRSLGLS